MTRNGGHRSRNVLESGFDSKNNSASGIGSATTLPDLTATAAPIDDNSDGDDTDIPPYLAEIHEFVDTHAANEEYDLLGNLPLNEDYTFDPVQEDIPNSLAEALFLGEESGEQSWAHLVFNARGESVIFYVYYTCTNRVSFVKGISLIHLMYPFRVFQESGFGGRGKEHLVTLVRYIYRETRKCDRPLGDWMLVKLVAALKEIGKNYDRQGGKY